MHATCGFPHSLTVLRDRVAIGWVNVDTLGYGNAKTFTADHGSFATVLLVDRAGPANPYVLGTPGEF